MKNQLTTMIEETGNLVELIGVEGKKICDTQNEIIKYNKMISDTFVKIFLKTEKKRSIEKCYFSITKTL